MSGMKLYPHQQALVDEARQAFRDGFKSPCIVSPCGSGKSVIIGEIARLTAENHKEILFLVHRKELKEQIYATFERSRVDMRFVTLGMVQTVVRRMHAMKPPSLIITDENHHALANSYRKIYQHFKDSLLLGFTATPVRLNMGGLGDVNDKLILGPTPRWLIENNYLSPYHYYAPTIIDTSKLKTSHGEFVVRDIEMNRLIYGDVIRYYRQLADGEQAICYCSSIAHSEEMAARFREAGISAVHFDSNTPKAERARIVRAFREKQIRILTNVDLIGEGFDVPDCSTVILLRPTKSLSLYIQQSMRGMRYRPGKTSIIIDHVGNVERFGLPDLERAWKLDPKKDANKDEEDAVKIKTCPACFAVVPKQVMRCTECGFEFIAEEPRGDVKEVDGELKEFTHADFQFTLNTKNYTDCKNMKELRQWCLQNGYKPGYAYYLGRNMGLVG